MLENELRQGLDERTGTTRTISSWGLCVSVNQSQVITHADRLLIVRRVAILRAQEKEFLEIRPLLANRLRRRVARFGARSPGQWRISRQNRQNPAMLGELRLKRAT
jgi:hypothetical protein